MIPKIIHYCWFGKGEKPKKLMKCIQSWYKFCPDYVIREWNEDNFDVQSNRFTSEAYQSRKYAFVTDYVRLQTLYEEGGIYLDTDVEIYKSFDSFTHHDAFAGFESGELVSTGLIAAVKGSIWIKELMQEYNGRSFFLPDGSMDITPNPIIITKYMIAKGLKQNNQLQDFPGLCTVYPSDYFCPKDPRNGLVRRTKNTVCIHHFTGTWLDNTFLSNLKKHVRILLIRAVGERPILYLTRLIRRQNVSGSGAK